MARHPLVSVIIPVLNEARDLPACLDALLAQRFPRERMEVLIVDGGSVDGTREVVAAYRGRFPHLRLLSNPEGTAGAGLNVGLRAARGEIIVRVDGHTILEPDYIPRAVAILQSGLADAVGGVLRPEGDTPTARVIAAVMAHPLGGGPAPFRHTTRPRRVDTVYLGVWRRETLEEIGGFAPDVPANEDFELYYRLRRAGKRILCDPQLRSRTRVRRSWRELWRQYRRYGRGKARVLRRHPRSLRPRQVPPILLAGLLPLSLLALPFPALRLPLLLLWGIYGGGTGWAAWRVARRGEGIPWLRAWVTFWIMHWAWTLGFWEGILLG